MLGFAVMGHGVVGSGVVEVFQKNYENIVSRAGTDFELKYVLDIRDFPDLDYSDKFTKNFDDILNDPDVTVVCAGRSAYDRGRRLPPARVRGVKR